MIFLKASTELKHTFKRLIQTMDVPVKWDDIFVVLNNYLILPGEVRSLIFNFDNRKVGTNVIEIPIVEEAIQPIERNVPLTNVLNMVLYAFGKWGAIPGLKVEKDYAQLNELFTEILRELKMEPGYRDDNFRFYQKGIQVTYEDVIQAAIEAGQKEENEEEAADEEKLGLWHNMRWAVSHASFVKGEVTAAEQETERIGSNFYMVGYQCPECGKKLHMVVYPVDKEFPVETEEGKVYLARAYACDNCNRFYTPRPGKLLSEGDIYLLDFEDDREAYEDYQELLGRRGEKTSNYKFNEYEWEREKKKTEEMSEKKEQEEELEELGKEEPEELTEEELEKMSEKEWKDFTREGLEQLEDKPESDFYRQEKVKNRKALKGKGELERKQTSASSISEKLERSSAKAGKLAEDNSAEAGKLVEDNSAKAGKQAEDNLAEAGKLVEDNSAKAGKQAEDNPAEAVKIREKYNARMKVIDRMSPRQLRELREGIKKEKLLEEPEKKEYIEAIDKSIIKNQERELQKRAENAKKGNYAQLCRNIEEIEKSDAPKEMKESVLTPLYQLRQEKAQTEAEALIANMPAVMDRKKYNLFRQKLEQYKEADITPFQKKLEERRKLAEQQEITSLVKQAGKNDRGALYRVWQRLQEPDFFRENTRQPLEEIYQRIQKLDEAAIDRICPDVMGMTFEEGQEAYEKIQSGMFLPEIKNNALEMIDKRLTKMKSDESELLVRKFQDELRGTVKDTSSIHYNEARKAMMGEWKGVEADIVNGAVNIYASERSRYEYPILVCDATRKGTGREGFLLTPEHLFYNSTFSSERIPILQIKNISFSTGLLNKGIYVNQKNGEKTKIPVGLPSREWEGFTRVLGEFIKYLQERPESRKVSYLAKEEHEVKCCYRCGYVYKGGDVCPKCGSRANK